MQERACLLSREPGARWLTAFSHAPTPTAPLLLLTSSGAHRPIHHPAPLLCLVWQVPIAEWLGAVVKDLGGEIVSEPTAADSPGEGVAGPRGRRGKVSGTVELRVKHDVREQAAGCGLRVDLPRCSITSGRAPPVTPLILPVLPQPLNPSSLASPQTAAWWPLRSSRRTSTPASSLSRTRTPPWRPHSHSSAPRCKGRHRPSHCPQVCSDLRGGPWHSHRARRPLQANHPQPTHPARPIPPPPTQPHLAANALPSSFPPSPLPGRFPGRDGIRR